MLHLRAALEARFETPPEWLLEDAKGLFHATIRDARHPTGRTALSTPWAGTASQSCANACAGQSSRRWARPMPLYRDRRGAVRSPVSEMVGLLHQVSDGLRKRIPVAGAGHQQRSDHQSLGRQAGYLPSAALLGDPRLPLAPGLAPAVAAGLLDSRAK